MFANRLADLDAENVVLVRGRGDARVVAVAAFKFDKAARRVDFRNAKAVLKVGMFDKRIEVARLFERDCFVGDGNAHERGDRVNRNVLDAQRLLIRIALFGDAPHFDLFHEAAAKRFERCEAIDEIAEAFVRGAVAEREQGIECAERLAALVRFKILRFVQNQYRARLLEKLIRLAFAGQFFGRAKNHVARLVERVERHHHHIGKGGGGELAQAAQLTAVVLIEVERLVAIERTKVVARDVEIFDHAFVDGDARHDDDEFAKAVLAAQFIERAQIHVGLARPRLHLDGEFGIAHGVVARPFERQSLFGIEHHREVNRHLVLLIFALNDLQVFEQPTFVERTLDVIGNDFVAERKGGGAARESFEKIHHTANRFELVLLVRVELELERHGIGDSR